MLTQICMEGTFFDGTRTSILKRKVQQWKVHYHQFSELKESLIHTLPSLQFWNRYVDTTSDIRQTEFI